MESSSLLALLQLVAQVQQALMLMEQQVVAGVLQEMELLHQEQQELVALEQAVMV
jgi:hypothetical protein